MKSLYKWLLVFCLNFFLFQGTSIAQRFTLGQKHRGGIVFYLDSGGSHGLIAGVKDIGMTGRENDFDYAKRSCGYYTTTVKGTTYHTWYLPSISELQLLFKQKDLVGGFKNAHYWSSTFQEFPSGNYFKLDFSTGDRVAGNLPTYIRPIQSF